MKASILICSLDREDSLKRLLGSLFRQTRQDFEIKLCQTRGNLVELKDKLWRKARGEILIWVDDDVWCPPNWFKNMVDLFDEYPRFVVGACGPTVVRDDFQVNRDIYKYKWIHSMYNKLFLDGQLYKTGYISKAGVNSIGGAFDVTSRRLPVAFLEPSAFALRRSVVEAEGGFDLRYGGVGEWCDVDLCYRVRRHGILFFDNSLLVKHFPERDDVANKRLDTKTRYENYCRWADKFIKKSFRHYMYRAFLRSYFFGKERRWF